VEYNGGLKRPAVFFFDAEACNVGWKKGAIRKPSEHYDAARSDNSDGGIFLCAFHGRSSIECGFVPRFLRPLVRVANDSTR
jgi:hypothetical protein